MKKIILILGLIIVNLSHLLSTGNETNKIKSSIEPLLTPSGKPIPSTVKVYDCDACNKKVYIISLKSKIKTRTLQIVVKDKISGLLEFKGLFIQSIDDPIPDPCYFTCDFDPIAN